MHRKSWINLFIAIIMIAVIYVWWYLIQKYIWEKYTPKLYQTWIYHEIISEWDGKFYERSAPLFVNPNTWTNSTKNYSLKRYIFFEKKKENIS